MQHKNTKLRGLATAIGTMPHLDPLEACSIVMANLKDIPAWPQLPNRSPLEKICAQYSDGFPGAVLKNDQLYVDRSLDLSTPLEKLYSAYLANDLDGYAISPEHAAGLHQFLKLKPKPSFAVKGHVTGPITFGLATTDQNRQPILYDETLADAVAKHLRLKAAWQERELAKLSPNTIIFIDEPYLVSLGSAFVALSEKTVITLIDEVLDGISGLKGIHCCGNTDWSVVMNTSIDILNFDAYTCGESLALYPGDLKAFLDRGGVLAWGIVPSDEKVIFGETGPHLIKRLEELMKSLAAKGIRYDILVEQCLITPSCGMATLSHQAASRVLELTSEVSREFRRSHNLV